jgi:cysteinyl-tRNA synthetase
MAKLQLYNTLSREKEEFVPLKEGEVGMYSCGPTVYHYAHIGNLRSFVFADTLKRVLKLNKYKVKHVINITDVGHLTDDGDDGEDKMEKGAKRDGKSVWDIAKFYTEAFLADIKALNIEEPFLWSKATEHIQEQIEQIKEIEAGGYTYKTEDGIYFDTSKMEEYGKLGRIKIEELQAGARVDMGGKKNKTDFALWKFSPTDEQRAMEWESPWGTGFPGWHIECSAMSTKYLGKQFDIHTGGKDLSQVHHCNEIAQAEAAYGKKPWVKYWLHNEFLVNDKGKMAKSKGEFLMLPTLTEKGYPALSYRYFLLSGHYRQQLMFSWEAMDSAKQSYERLKNIVEELQETAGEEKGEVEQSHHEKFLEAVNDDINTPQALAVVWDLLREKELSPETKLATVEEFDSVLGLNLLEKEDLEIPQEIIDLAEQREQARAEKDWAKSDTLRDEIAAKGWQILDGKEGYKIKPHQA